MNGGLGLDDGLGPLRGRRRVEVHPVGVRAQQREAGADVGERPGGRDGGVHLSPRNGHPPVCPWQRHPAPVASASPARRTRTRAGRRPPRRPPTPGTPARRRSATARGARTRPVPRTNPNWSHAAPDEVHEQDEVEPERRELVGARAVGADAADHRDEQDARRSTSAAITISSWSRSNHARRRGGLARRHRVQQQRRARR